MAGIDACSSSAAIRVAAPGSVSTALKLPSAGVATTAVMSGWRVMVQAAEPNTTPSPVWWAAIVVRSPSTARARPVSSRPWSIQPMSPSTNRWASSASAPNHMPASVPSSSTPVNPAAVKMPRTRSGSDSENGPGASGGGAGRSRPAASALEISRIHSLAASGCHATSTSRPPRTRAWLMLVNAAVRSPKNMVPVRLIATSKLSGGNGWTWASTCSKDTLGTASSCRLAAGDVEHPRRQVDTERRAAGRGAGGVAGGLTGAAADVEDPIRSGDRRGGQQPLVVGGDGAVEVLGVLGPVGALIAVPGLKLVGIGRVDRALRWWPPWHPPLRIRVSLWE